MTVLVEGSQHTEHKKGGHGRYESPEESRRGYTGEPHHRCGGVTNHASGTPGVGGSNNRGQKPDANLAPVYMSCDYAADNRPSDVVEEDRQAEDEGQQYQPAGPPIGQQPRYGVRQIALFEVVREDGEANKQQHQVGERHPFMAEVENQARQARSFVKACEDELVGYGRSQPGERHRKGTVVENSDTRQCQAEKKEL